MKRLMVLMLSLLLLVATDVYAQELKIGVVNIDEVIQKSPLALSYNEKISKLFKPRQDELNALQKKLQDDMDKLSYSGYQLSTNDRNKLQATINAEKRDFDLMGASLQKDLLFTQSQYTEVLMSKLNTVINKIAQEGGYDMIQTSGNVLYLNGKMDLTSQVIQQLK